MPIPPVEVEVDKPVLKVEDIIFREKGKEDFKPLDITSDNKKTIEFKPVEMSKVQQTSFTPIDLIPLVGPAIQLGKLIVESGEEEKEEPVIESQPEPSFRLEKLPIQEQDFAVKWHYATQADVDEKIIIDEFNAYHQLMDELDKNEIPLPEGFTGKQLSNDLKTFILKDFRAKNIKLNTQNNLAHRAFYSHCTKRAIDSVREGEFIGKDGYIRKRPEIADILESRINQILFEKMIS